VTLLDASPVKIDLRVPDGTDVDVEFQLTDGTDPINITSDDVMFTAKSVPQGVVKVATKTNGVGDHSSPAIGKTVFALTRTELALADEEVPETWAYEVRRSSGGKERVYISGVLRVGPMVGTDA